MPLTTPQKIKKLGVNLTKQDKTSWTLHNSDKNKEDLSKWRDIPRSQIENVNISKGINTPSPN